MREFDDRIVVLMFGYKDSNEYYVVVIFYDKFVDKINVLFLCLNVVDDLFFFEDFILCDLFFRCFNVLMVLI